MRGYAIFFLPGDENGLIFSLALTCMCSICFLPFILNQADDMGLGKTMQTLAYLGSLMRARTISNAIVVCPKSVVQNWER